MSADIISSALCVWAQIPPIGDGSGFWRCTLFASHNALLLLKAEVEIKDQSLRVLQSHKERLGERWG